VETRLILGQWDGVQALFAVVKDVSEIRLSEEKFSKAFHHTPVLTAISTLAEGRYVDVNDAFLDVLGYSRAEVIGRTTAELGVFLDFGIREETVRLMKEQGYARNLEVRYCGKDRVDRWGVGSAVLLDVGDVPCLLSTMLDITDRKRAVEALRRKNEALDQSVAQLRKLAMELTLAEERERKRLARVLHDEVQQLLVAATMRVSLLDRQDPAPEHTRHVKEALDLLDRTLAVTRSMSTDLYPPVLMDGGFMPALRWLVGRMKETHDLTVTLAGEAAMTVPAPHAIVLFEGVRELLFNVIKHAGVKQASVTLGISEDGMIQVEVGDHGIGFSSAHASIPTTPGGLGLFQLRERLAYMGGTLEVAGVAGRGTRATITLPITDHH